MKKHLATIIGIVLALGVAFGAFTWDSAGREASSMRRSNMLHSTCYAEQRAATGAPVSQAFPECDRYLDESRAGQSARLTSSAMVGAAAGGGFALLFFGGLWFLRRRRAAAAGAGA
jgi:MYXO-CTERM domain-containing protein